jgi:aspartyl/asparaginyl beta-hydroxylase (cupin superfamily)
VFDHRDRHEARNDSDRPRDVLLLDFVAADDELARLEPWRRSRALQGRGDAAINRGGAS